MSEQHAPEPTVGALIFNPRGELLLVKAPRWRGKYVVPGGHIELGEWMEEALVREVKEETGLDIDGIEFICFQEFIFDPAYRRKSHFIFFDFACRTGSTDVVLNEEGEDYVWASLEKALEMAIDPYTEVAIREYMRQKGIRE